MPCEIGYKGEVDIDGKKEGFGTNTYMDGGRYVGAWKNDVREGKGTMFHASGDRYEGAWVNDTMHGTGVKYYAEGDGSGRMGRGMAAVPATMPMEIGGRGR